LTNIKLVTAFLVAGIVAIGRGEDGSRDPLGQQIEGEICDSVSKCDYLAHLIYGKRQALP
jgi:hypothetical protein